MSSFISLRIITKLIAYNINSNFLSFIFEKLIKNRDKRKNTQCSGLI